MTQPTSLIDRAGLDRPRVAKILARGLEGADDGELFLEYRQSEMLVFDNGRLKQATYDTSQGFGLRAVKDEAVGYAHASDVSEAGDRARRRRGARRQGRLFRPLCRGARRAPTSGSTATTIRSARPAFETKVRLLEEIDAYARAKDPRVRQVSVSLGATWQVVEILRADGETYRDVRPLVRVNVSVVAGDGDRQETGSHGYGGREGYERFIDHRRLAERGRRGGAPGAGQSRRGAGAGRRDGRGARPRLARRDAARGGRPRARRRFQPQEDLGLRRPDGPAGRRQGRHRGRRRHHGGAARLALDRRRRHADQPHRADRGRHPGRLHAGPPERAADGHEADRQRPARELRPRADAAHDQHLHAGRRPRPGRDHRLGQERHLRRAISAAARSTSPRANTCSSAPRPTGSRTARSARRSRAPC